MFCPFTSPMPPMLTSSVTVGRKVNVAITDFASNIETRQVSLFPLQAPLQPSNMLSLSLYARRRILEPWGRLVVHVGVWVVHANWFLSPVMRPWPVPARVTDSGSGGIGKNVAFTCVSLLVDTMQSSSFPLHSPPQDSR